MKVNFNMAVGFVKRFLINILIEDDVIKRQELSNILFNNILNNWFQLEKKGNIQDKKIENWLINILSIKENRYN